MKKHNFTVAYTGQSRCVQLMDIYLFTNDLDEKKAKLQLIEELNEDEEGQVDDLHSIYPGVGESEVA